MLPIHLFAPQATARFVQHCVAKRLPSTSQHRIINSPKESLYSMKHDAKPRFMTEISSSCMISHHSSFMIQKHPSNESMSETNLYRYIMIHTDCTPTQWLDPPPIPSPQPMAAPGAAGAAGAAGASDAADGAPEPCAPAAAATEGTTTTSQVCDPTTRLKSSGYPKNWRVNHG